MVYDLFDLCGIAEEKGRCEPMKNDTLMGLMKYEDTNGDWA